MAVIHPDLENIQRLKVPPTPGEWDLVSHLQIQLDDTYEVFFNPFLDGDRPDLIILKEHCAAFVIEVKDWNLKNYSVTEKNRWEVFDGSRSSVKGSPHSQAFRYKKNLYDLHLPVVGLERLTNPNFFNLVNCFVYFFGSGQAEIDSLYSPAEKKQKEEREKLNNSFKKGDMEFQAYDTSCNYVDRNKRALERDKRMSFGSDRVAHLVKTIKKRSTHVLFDERVYQDFKRRLSPSEHTKRQGVPINFDKKQLALIESRDGKEKIKGVAGCGKTSILAQRAINAHQRHDSPVLILTYNITLKNYVKDKISDINGARDFTFFEISNYHQFFNSQVNNVGMDMAKLVEKYGIGRLYSVDVFGDSDTVKYRTILVDEIQDYQSEWVKIVRDNFLYEDGEMVLFGDDSQNIYHRDAGRSPVIAQGFGRWVKLKRSYRTGIDSPLNQLFKDFQLQFLVEKYSDTEVIDVIPTQLGIGYGLLKYELVSETGWEKAVFDSVQSFIKGYDLNPNDVVILSSQIYLVRKLNEFWKGQEKTHCMFDTYAELSECVGESVEELVSLNNDDIKCLIDKNKADVDMVRRSKKNHFYANSGLIKLSTIHSYKGLESKVVFYVMGEHDDAEIVYTSITRSSENLVIFDIGSKNICSEYFRQSIK